MGMPQEYMEDHEPNKRARMVAKPKATPGPSTALGLGVLLIMLNMLWPCSLVSTRINCPCSCKLFKWSKEAPLILLNLTRMLGGSAGHDVIEEEEGKRKLVSRRKNKINFLTFSKCKG